MTHILSQGWMIYVWLSLTIAAAFGVGIAIGYKSAKVKKS